MMTFRDLADVSIRSFSLLVVPAWGALLLACVVGVVVLAGGRRMSPTLKCWLWGLVLVRLMLPWSLESRWSLLNLVQHSDSPVTVNDTLAVSVEFARDLQPSPDAIMPYTSQPEASMSVVELIAVAWLFTGIGIVMWSLFADSRFSR